MSVIEQLKQRNVFRVAALYLVGAWLILQVTDVLSGVFQLPPSLMTIVASVLAIAFVPALVLAWVFELTPEGIKREQDVDRADATVARRGRRLTVATIGLLLVAVGVYFSEPLWRGSVTPEVTETVAGVDATQKDQSLVADLGIAVLPFENLSADQENAFFAGGVHEEVLGNLSRIVGLRVISRTSMMRIAETNLDVRGIGARLGVTHVLEGSVRRAAERVRVSVQLINASNDEQLWSENYDATLDDIFEIQTDIAQQIAGSLRATLTPADVASMQTAPTQNQTAYDLYLRAVQENSFWQGTDTFTAMRAQLEEALRLDPDFIEARVLLMIAYGRLYWLRNEREDDVFAQRAAEQLAIIEAAAPTSITARKSKAIYTYLVDYDYQTAFELLQPLHEELPNNASILRYLSSSLKRLSRNELFLEAARASVELDPESGAVAGELYLALADNRRFAEAEAVARRTANRFPADESTLGHLIQVLMLRGKLDEADAALRRYIEIDSEAKYWRERIWLTYAREGLEAAQSVLQPAIDDFEALNSLSEMALIIRHAGGDTAKADEYARTALERSAALAAEQLPALTDYMQSFVYSQLTKIAAIAGDRAAYTSYRNQFESLTANRTTGRWSVFSRGPQFFDIAFAQAVLGDPEGGWAFYEPYMNVTGLTDYSFATAPARSEFAFGSVAGYQQFVRDNRPAWTAPDAI